MTQDNPQNPRGHLRVRDFPLLDANMTITYTGDDITEIEIVYEAYTETLTLSYTGSNLTGITSSITGTP